MLSCKQATRSAPAKSKTIELMLYCVTVSIAIMSISQHALLQSHTEAVTLGHILHQELCAQENRVVLTHPMIHKRPREPLACNHMRGSNRS